MKHSQNENSLKMSVHAFGRKECKNKEEKMKKIDASHAYLMSAKLHENASHRIFTQMHHRK